MIVWSYWPAPTGGAEAQCRKLSHALVQKGIKVTVLTARQTFSLPANTQDKGVAIHRMATPLLFVQFFGKLWNTRSRPANGLSKSHARSPEPGPSGIISRMLTKVNVMFFMAGMGIYLWIHRKQIDLLHVHTGDWIAGYTYKAGQYLRIPVLCKGANMPPLPEIGKEVPFRKKMAEWRKKNTFVVLHDAMKERLEQQGVPAARIHVIPNGVPIPEDSANPGNEGIVLCAANFSQGHAHKGFDVLLEAWKLVGESFPESTLWMAGGGDAGFWKQRAKELGIEKRVEFPGYLHEHKSLYGGACMLLLPSRYEGISNVLLEAQAWGLPVVVTNIPGSQAVVTHEYNGLIVGAGDPVGLAEAIQTLLGNPDMRYTLGAAGKKNVEERFSMKRICEQYEHLYRLLTVRAISNPGQECR